jgi:hypothetical protein
MTPLSHSSLPMPYVAQGPSIASAFANVCGWRQIGRLDWALPDGARVQYIGSPERLMSLRPPSSGWSLVVGPFPDEQRQRQRFVDIALSHGWGLIIPIER